MAKNLWQKGVVVKKVLDAAAVGDRQSPTPASFGKTDDDPFLDY